MRSFRKFFKEFIKDLIKDLLKKTTIHNVQKGLDFAEEFGYPVVFVPSFSLHRAGTAVALNREQLASMLEDALSLSPLHEVIIKKLKF